MRFHVPPGLEGEDPVQAFLDHVLSKASIIHATGESIVTFQELQCLTPRGRLVPFRPPKALVLSYENLKSLVIMLVSLSQIRS